MTNPERELDRLFDAPILKPPADFLDNVMRQVQNVRSPLWEATVSQRIQANKQLKVVALKLTKIAAFVFGIMLATAAV